MFSKEYCQVVYLGNHNGSNGQIWDRRSSQKYNCLYYFCLQTHQKTNGTNGKVVSQGFILALTKNTFSSLTPSKLGKIQFFRAFKWIFQTGVLFFWLNPTFARFSNCAVAPGRGHYDPPPLENHSREHFWGQMK